MLHQYAHIKSWKSQPRERQSEREGKTNFCFIASSWNDHPFLKLSPVSWPEPIFPSELGYQGGDCHRWSVEVETPPWRCRGRNLEGEFPIHNWKFTVDVSPSYQIDGWKWGLISNPRSTLAVSYNIMFSECSPSPQNQCMGYRLLITKDPDHSLSFNVRMRAIVLLPRLLTMSHCTFSDTEQLFIVKLSYPSLSRI